MHDRKVEFRVRTNVNFSDFFGRPNLAKLSVFFIHVKISKIVPDALRKF